MFEYPKLLTNPFNPIYNLEDSEIYSIKEAQDLILIEKYSYSLFAFWTCVVINLQRRIENFGINIFLNMAKKSGENEPYNINGNTLKDRWLNINEYKIIDYAKKLNIINHVSHDIITTLFWMKSNTNEDENKNLTQQEILSIVYLLEKNLFLLPFKEDKRGKNPTIINSKMKFRRKDDTKTDYNDVPKTHHELMLRSGVKIFEEQNKKIETHNILDEYC